MPLCIQHSLRHRYRTKEQQRQHYKHRFLHSHVLSHCEEHTPSADVVQDLCRGKGAPAKPRRLTADQTKRIGEKSGEGSMGEKRFVEQTTTLLR
jgi:hypothetical protein